MLSTLALVWPQSGCKRKRGKGEAQAPTCDPSKAEWKLHVLIQPSPTMNLDDEGRPLDTVVRLYQLNSDTAATALDFQELWTKGGAVFGDTLVKESELTVFAGRDVGQEITPEAKTTHIVAAAIFRKPIGNTWYRVYKVPLDHGEAVCAKPGVSVPDPCFFVLVDTNQIDGGPTPPSAFDRSKLTFACAPPSMPKTAKKPAKSADEGDGASRLDKAKSGAQKGKDGADKGLDAASQGQKAADTAQGAPDKAKSLAKPPKP